MFDSEGTDGDTALKAISRVLLLYADHMLLLVKKKEKRGSYSREHMSYEIVQGH